MNPSSPSVLTTKQGIRFHPRFQARALDSGEIVLLSEEDTHVLSGSEYTALEPLLDGSRNPDALAECLAEYFPHERIYYALARLQARGLLALTEQTHTNSTDLDEGSEPLPEKISTPQHIHVYKKMVRQSLASRLASGVVLEPITVSGWGTSDEEARTRCLGEAEERRCMFSAPALSLHRARLCDLDGRAIGLEELEPRSVSRHSRHTVQKSLEPRRRQKSCDYEIIMDWVKAWSWSRQQPIWLPATYCFFAHADTSPASYYRTNSSGCAAGDCLNDAVLRGLFELIERDACAQWNFNEVRRPQIDITALSDTFPSTSLKAIQDAGRILKVFDLTHDVGIPVIAAVSWRVVDGLGFKVGLGARTEYSSAIRQAVGELNQLIFGNNEASADIPAPKHIRIPETNSVEALHFIESWDLPVDSALVLERYLKKLNQHGLEIIVLDLTETRNTFHVVRVVVPGLRSISTQFLPIDG